MKRALAALLTGGTAVTLLLILLLPASADGIGGTISLGTVSSNTVQVNTSAATDGWSGFNIHIGTASSAGITLSSISAANGTLLVANPNAPFCASTTPTATEKVFGCTSLDNPPPSSPPPGCSPRSPSTPPATAASR